jgi:hypothetical protein
VPAAGTRPASPPQMRDGAPASSQKKSSFQRREPRLTLPVPGIGGHASAVSSEYPRPHEGMCRSVLRQRRAFRHLHNCRLVGNPGVMSGRSAGLLCSDCGRRRCACCRPDPRQPASAPGSRSRGRAATFVNADLVPGSDDLRRSRLGRSGSTARLPQIVPASARVGRIRASTRQVVLLLAQEGGRLVKSLDVAVEDRPLQLPDQPSGWLPPAESEHARRLSLPR